MGVNNIDLNHSGSVEASETCIHSGGPLYGCCCLNLFLKKKKFWGGCLLEAECAASHLQRKTACLLTLSDQHLTEGAVTALCDITKG